MDPEMPWSSLHLEKTICKLPIAGIESDEGMMIHSKAHAASSVNEQSCSLVLEQSHGILPISMKTPCIDDKESTTQVDSVESAEVAAAVTVQKVYRSYRTRRNLADCAVIGRKFGWWNVLDSALLQNNSVTFYAFGKKDSVANRWSRLQRKAAKVGKGLSKDEKARKLALQHWLEAIDARHRYGHNLHYYYTVWQENSTHEPFFYWLDVGEGRDLDLPTCPRSKLQNQQIKYLGPKEREHYEVVVEDGKLIYKESGELLNTPKGDKWIFVMSTSGKLYVAQKEKGKLQHSSFLAGAATTAAGRLLVRDGIMELMEAHSGHYHPTEENFKELVNILTKLGADLKMAKVQAVSDDMLNPHHDELLRTSNDNKGAKSIELIIKQSETISSSLHEHKEVEELVQVNKNAEVDQGSQHTGTEGKPLGSFSNIWEKDAEDFPSSLEGLHIEYLDHVESNTEVGNTPDQGLSTGKDPTFSSAEDMPIIDSSSTQYFKEAKPGVLQQAQTDAQLPKWSSGTGARISSLTEIPHEIVMKSWECLDRPLL